MFSILLFQFWRIRGEKMLCTFQALTPLGKSQWPASCRELNWCVHLSFAPVYTWQYSWRCSGISCCGSWEGFQALYVFRWLWMFFFQVTIFALHKLLNSLQGEINDTPEMHCKESRPLALSVSSALKALSSLRCWCCVLFSSCVESHPCLHWGAATKLILQEEMLGICWLTLLRLTWFHFSFETTEKLSVLHPKKWMLYERKSLCLLYLRRITIWHDLIIG